MCTKLYIHIYIYVFIVVYMIPPIQLVGLHFGVVVSRRGEISSYISAQPSKFGVQVDI